MHFPDPSPPLNLRLMTAAECRAADAASSAAGIPITQLMQAAGRAVAHCVHRFTRPCRVLVLCGPGNNGGDGFAAACFLRELGWPVLCCRMLPDVPFSPAASVFAARWDSNGGHTLPFSPDLAARNDLIVDAVFGTGLSRPVTGELATAFAALQASGTPVIAVDLPSGLDTDSGAVLGTTLPAVATVTFGWQKPAHVLLPGKDLCGGIVVADIGLVPPPPADTPLFRNAPPLWQALLPEPGLSTHKYTRGHAVVVAGAEATGAARLAATAAARSGCGLVTALMPERSHGLFGSLAASILTRPFQTPEAAATLFGDPRVHAMLIGPGAGVNAETQTLVFAALATGKPTVLDADALTVFQDDPKALFSAVRGPVILTPHSGEFARLFPSLAKINNKITQAAAAARTSSAVVVLKGSDTVIATPKSHTVIVNDTAPAWLATGGSGDVLAGLIVGLLAQGMPAVTAANAGVWLHGKAAIRCDSGLIADDMPSAIHAERQAMRLPLQKNTRTYAAE